MISLNTKIEEKARQEAELAAFGERSQNEGAPRQHEYSWLAWLAVPRCPTSQKGVFVVQSEVDGASSSRHQPPQPENRAEDGWLRPHPQHSD